MTFWQIFFRVLLWEPLPALGALWWHLTGRRVRARNRLRTAGASLPFAYRFWIRKIEKSDEPNERAATSSRNAKQNLRFTILLYAHDDDTPGQLSQSLESVRKQIHADWNVAIVLPSGFGAAGLDGHGRFGSWTDALDQAEGDYVVPLRAGDRLSRWALFHIAETVGNEHAAAIVYGDQDETDAFGQRDHPWFKPRWNEELFLAQDYLSRACAIRAETLHAALSTLEAGAQPSPFSLLLRIIAGKGGAIVHIPHILFHVLRRPAVSDVDDRLDAIEPYVAPRGARATEGPYGTVKVEWPLPGRLPLVSIVVPTKDKLDLLRACVDSVLDRTTYEPFEILIVDNGSVESRTLAYLDRIQSDPRVQVLAYPEPYNYSAINNFAVGEANGSYVCLLNNDTVVVGQDWLTEMMRYAVRPEVGGVGAKLLYPDGTIQHAGVIVGIGEGAGHAHRNLPADDPGYFCRAHVAQFVSAVTGACLLVDKRKFLSVGGLDAESLAIAYNDVDLCLKLERAGWRNVYVPHAVLIHHESKSRAKDHSPGQVDRYRRELKVFQDRWGARIYDDPLFNPNFDRSSETFVIRL